MTEKTQLDTSKLLGYNNSGQAIWAVVESEIKADGASKPAGIGKPAGNQKL